MKINLIIGNLFILLTIFFAGKLAAQEPSSSNFEEIISNEQARSIARNISSSIVGAISDPSDGGKKRFGAGSSADGNSLLPDAIWSESSWTEISNDSLPNQADADIYQFTFGTDKRFGDFLLVPRLFMHILKQK